MYVTAHRVKSTKGEVGINSFLHKHSEEEQGSLDWSPPDILAVAEGTCGTLVDRSYDVPPGGNRVLSYLDVTAIEGTATDAIEEALRIFRDKIGKVGTPIIDAVDNVGIRFSTILGLADRELHEFDALTERLLAILRTGKQAEPAEEEPLRIFVSFSEEGYHFQLSGESVARVRALHPSGSWESARFNVKPDVMMDFQQMHGSIIPHVILALTGLRLENVIDMGGVLFLKSDTQEEIRRWPKKE